MTLWYFLLPDRNTVELQLQSALPQHTNHSQCSTVIRNIRDSPQDKVVTSYPKFDQCLKIRKENIAVSSIGRVVHAAFVNHMCISVTNCNCESLAVAVTFGSSVLSVRHARVLSAHWRYAQQFNRFLQRRTGMSSLWNLLCHAFKRGIVWNSAMVSWKFSTCPQGTGAVIVRGWLWQWVWVFQQDWCSSGVTARVFDLTAARFSAF